MTDKKNLLYQEQVQGGQVHQTFNRTEDLVNLSRQKTAFRDGVANAIFGVAYGVLDLKIQAAENNYLMDIKKATTGIIENEYRANIENGANLKTFEENARKQIDDYLGNLQGGEKYKKFAEEQFLNLYDNYSRSIWQTEIRNTDSQTEFNILQDVENQTQMKTNFYYNKFSGGLNKNDIERMRINNEETIANLGKIGLNGTHLFTPQQRMSLMKNLEDKTTVNGGVNYITDLYLNDRSANNENVLKVLNDWENRDEIMARYEITQEQYNDITRFTSKLKNDILSARTAKEREIKQEQREYKRELKQEQREYKRELKEYLREKKQEQKDFNDWEKEKNNKIFEVQKLNFLVNMETLENQLEIKDNVIQNKDSNNIETGILYLDNVKDGVAKGFYTGEKAAKKMADAMTTVHKLINNEDMPVKNSTKWYMPSSNMEWLKHIAGKSEFEINKDKEITPSDVIKTNAFLNTYRILQQQRVNFRANDNKTKELISNTYNEQMKKEIMASYPTVKKDGANAILIDGDIIPFNSDEIKSDVAVKTHNSDYVMKLNRKTGKKYMVNKNNNNDFYEVR
ncbi:MAG: hypothetical protein LBC92_00345 [Rickettsiales bacterium]|jgi:hypothetical protein|nr:hypothetical protein [Rickettsiales bacterium]